MNTNNLAPITFAIAVVALLSALAYVAGREDGKASELARWKQLVLPLGMSLVKRYDPITGEARMLIIKDDKTTVLEIKP